MTDTPKAPPPTEPHGRLDQFMCAVCDKPFDPKAHRIEDDRLRDCLDILSITGWGVCPEHVSLIEKGYILLVECDPHQTRLPLTTPGDAFRTGLVAGISRHAYRELFSVPLPEVGFAFTEPSMMEFLKTLHTIAALVLSDRVREVSSDPIPVPPTGDTGKA